MSWQDRIERYNRARNDEIIAKRRLVEERRMAAVPQLREILNGLRAEDRLTSIRDEVWELGTISVEGPGDIEVTVRKGIVLEDAEGKYFTQDSFFGVNVFGISIALTASWAVYKEESQRDDDRRDRTRYNRSIVSTDKILRIDALYDEGNPQLHRNLTYTSGHDSKKGIFLSVFHYLNGLHSGHNKLFSLDDPDLSQKIDDELIAILANRPSLSRQKEMDEAEITRQIESGFRQGGMNPNEGGKIRRLFSWLREKRII